MLESREVPKETQNATLYTGKVKEYIALTVPSNIVADVKEGDKVFPVPNTVLEFTLNGVVRYAVNVKDIIAVERSNG